MKKLFNALMILLAIFIGINFVSCNNDTKSEADEINFVGEWIQDSLETKITIKTPGTFTIASIDEDFEGVNGTYTITDNGANIILEGSEDVFSLVMLEKDAFKIVLPAEMGGDAFFVKYRETEIDYNGTWQTADKSITAQMNDSNDALIVTLGTGEDAINIAGNFEEEDNMFIMFADGEDTNLVQEIGSGVVSVSGKAYTFCMDATGDWSSTILTKIGD